MEQNEPYLAPKITGMIIDLDQSKVLPLLESSDALKAMVQEAIEVLSDWVSQQLQLLEQENSEIQASMLSPKL